jgi:hypothetical protein
MLSGPMNNSSISRPPAKKSIVGTAKMALSEFLDTTGKIDWQSKLFASEQ